MSKGNVDNALVRFPILVQNNSNITVSNNQIQDKIAYATSLCLATGLWQIILSIFKFGKLSWLMSEIILSAFGISRGVPRSGALVAYAPDESTYMPPL